MGKHSGLKNRFQNLKIFVDVSKFQYVVVCVIICWMFV